MQWLLPTLCLTDKIMKYFALLFCLVLVIVSCSEESGESAKKEREPEVTGPEEFEGVEVLFDDQGFQYPNAVDLLREINICSLEKQDSLGVPQTQCTPDNFKFFELKEGAGIQDGFILLVKANTGGIALRRILIFERENGSLVKLNGFVANLIGFRKSGTEHRDLLLRFNDKIEGSDVFYNCIFTWKDGKYAFKSVETIHEPAAQWVGRVREDVKDSTSKEILKIIEENQMIF